jgi:pSer/pThr/pTyr-binding forkhead associated (FHA) protein
MLLYGLEKSKPLPRLEWTEMPGEPRTLSLTAERILIGRRTDADIVLTHRLTSRQHAQICREGEAWVLVDLKSTHGTFVNGNRVDRHPLHNRDKFRLGLEGTEIVFLEREPLERELLDRQRLERKREDTSSASTGLLQSVALDLSVRKLASVIPEDSGVHSELEKVSCLLDFQYSFGQAFSAEKTFHHILKSALQISGAERGFVMRKEAERGFGMGKEKGGFSYALGLDSSQKTLRGWISKPAIASFNR